MTPTQRRKIDKLILEFLAELPTLTHYQVLRVHAGATLEELTAARRTLALQFHPDRLQDSADAGRLLGAINSAFDVLSTPSRLKRYRVELQSAMDTCVNCNGHGFARKQKGFTQATLVGCKLCAGSGFTARLAPKSKKR